MDQKREDLSGYEQKSEFAKRMWESVFNCKSNEKPECKKTKFKWVY